MDVGIKKKRPPQAPERLRGRLHTNTVYAITTMNVLEILSQALIVFDS